MNRMEIANAYHDRGFNCCQSVLAAYLDSLNLPEETALSLGAGFGSGAGTGELCGAVTGAIMALDLMLPIDLEAPAAGKRRAAALSRELQKRCAERFDAVRCRELLKNTKEEPSPAVAAMGLTNHCAVMIASAVELTEELLEEELAREDGAQ